MRFVNYMLVAAVLVLGLAVTASAMDKEELLHGPTVIVPEALEGSRAIGDDCTDPIVINSLPYSDLNQTTCGRGNTYSTTCLGSYDGGEDIIYRLDLAAATVVDIVMDPLGTTWTGITIDDVCPPDASCIATVTNSGASPRQLLGLNLAAGSYYIMIDTWPTPNCIPAFNLTVDVAAPPDPGETCGTAVTANEDLNSAPLQPYWYVFTGPTEAWTLILDSCIPGQTIDTYVKVYDACGGLLLGSNDDMGSTACPAYSYATHLELGLAASQTVYILWDNTYSSAPFSWNLYVLVGGVPVESSSWSNIKAIYR